MSARVCSRRTGLGAFPGLRTFIGGALLCMVYAGPVSAEGKAEGKAAEKRATADRSPSPGMYGTYQNDSRTRFDQSLGDTHPMTDAQLLPALLSALDQLSKYPRPSTLPELHRLPSSELQKLICGGPCAALAVYRPGEGIFLDEKLKPEIRLFDRSVLLHELVHYLQDLNNQHADMKPCSRWYHREQEAYAIQKNFLIIVGSPVRVGYSAHKSTCDDEVVR